MTKAEYIFNKYAQSIVKFLPTTKLKDLSDAHLDLLLHSILKEETGITTDYTNYDNPFIIPKNTKSRGIKLNNPGNILVRKVSDFAKTYPNVAKYGGKITSYESTQPGDYFAEFPTMFDALNAKRDIVKSYGDISLDDMLNKYNYKASDKYKTNIYNLANEKLPAYENWLTKSTERKQLQDKLISEQKSFFDNNKSKIDNTFVQSKYILPEKSIAETK